MKTGRNEPCPCGSGQKFKRCCAQLAAAPDAIDTDAAATADATEPAAPLPRQNTWTPVQRLSPTQGPPTWGRRKA